MPLVVPNLDVGPLQEFVFFVVLDDRKAEKHVSFLGSQARKSHTTNHYTVNFKSWQLLPSIVDDYI